LLEESLDTKLLDRGPRGIFLTPMGEDLLPHAKIILNERERAVASLNILRGQQGETLSLGADSAFATRRLPTAIVRMTEAFPDIQIRIIESNFPSMLSMLREGRLDVAFGSRAPYLDLTELDFEHLTFERASIVARAQHPILKSGKPTWDEMVKAKWIVSDEPSVLSGWTQMFASKKLPVPRGTLLSSAAQVVRQLLLNGDYLSVCDYTACASEIESGAIVQLDPDATKFQRPAGLFRRSGSKLSRGAVNLIDILRTVCAEEVAAREAVRA